MLCLEHAATNIGTKETPWLASSKYTCPAVLLREVYQQQALMQQALVSAQAMSA